MNIKTDLTTKIGNLEGVRSPSTILRKNDLGNEFSDIFTNKLNSTGSIQEKSDTTELTFSKHAVDRMRDRGISLNQEKLQKLDQAVKDADAKGLKESLVIMDDSALIVSIQNKKVITAIDKNAMNGNFFTNIDSTILL